MFETFKKIIKGPTPREEVLAEAEQIAEALRRAGYKDAEVAPVYCIEASIGPDGYFTKTISVYAGNKHE